MKDMWESPKSDTLWKKTSIESQTSNITPQQSHNKNDIVWENEIKDPVFYSVQQEVHREHAGMDTIITPDTAPLRAKLQALIASNDANIYKLDSYLWSHESHWLIRFIKPTLLNWLDFSKAQEKIREIKAWNQENKLLAIDFEPGYFPNIDFTEQDYRKYKVPEIILQLWKKQKEERKNAGKSIDTLNALPSQEYVWNYYFTLSQWDKNSFLTIMKEYGYAIGEMLQDLWVDIVFWPVVDTISKNSWANKDVALQWRSFWSAKDWAWDLAVSYIKGMLEWGKKVLPVAKHFIANGLWEWDAHTSWEVRIHGLSRTQTKEAWPQYVWSQTLKLQKSTDKNIQDKKERDKRRRKGLRENLDEWWRILTSLEDAEARKLTPVKPVWVDEKRWEENKKIFFSLPEKARSIWIANHRKRIGEQIWKINQKEVWKPSQENETPIQSENNNSPTLWVMTSHTAWYFHQKNWPVIYDKRNISQIKNLWGGDNTLIISDDLGMDASDTFLKKVYERFPQYSRDAIRIYAALSAGNDIAFKQYIHTNLLPSDAREHIIDEVIQMINNGVDIDDDGKWDLTEKDITYKYSKFLRILHTLWKVDEVELTDGNVGYIFKKNIEKLVHNVSSVKVFRDMVYSNMWPWDRYNLSHETTNTDNKEWKHLGWFYSFLKWIESLAKGWYYFLTSENLKKDTVVIVDKSVQKLFLVDGTSYEIKKTFPIAIGKGTTEKSGLHDRREFGDGKTPVWFYKVSGFKHAEQLYKEFWEGYNEYGWKDGGMVVLTWPWAPNIAIHWTDAPIQWNGKDLLSNWCVRMVNSDLSELLKNVPEWTPVIITN